MTLTPFNVYACCVVSNAHRTLGTIRLADRDIEVGEGGAMQVRPARLVAVTRSFEHELAEGETMIVTTETRA